MKPRLHCSATVARGNFGLRFEEEEPAPPPTKADSLVAQREIELADKRASQRETSREVERLAAEYSNVSGLACDVLLGGKVIMWFSGPKQPINAPNRDDDPEKFEAWLADWTERKRAARVRLEDALRVDEHARDGLQRATVALNLVRRIQSELRREATANPEAKKKK